jgi:hypothetical protein
MFFIGLFYLYARSLLTQVRMCSVPLSLPRQTWSWFSSTNYYHLNLALLSTACHFLCPGRRGGQSSRRHTGSATRCFDGAAAIGTRPLCHVGSHKIPALVYRASKVRKVAASDCSGTATVDDASLESVMVLVEFNKLLLPTKPCSFDASLDSDMALV